MVCQTRPSACAARDETILRFRHLPGPESKAGQRFQIKIAGASGGGRVRGGQVAMNTPLWSLQLLRIDVIQSNAGRML